MKQIVKIVVANYATEARSMMITLHLGREHVV
jgi:hypothetical protein